MAEMITLKCTRCGKKYRTAIETLNQDAKCICGAALAAEATPRAPAAAPPQRPAAPIAASGVVPDMPPKVAAAPKTPALETPAASRPAPVPSSVPAPAATPRTEAPAAPPPPAVSIAPAPPPPPSPRPEPAPKPVPRPAAATAAGDLAMLQRVGEAHRRIVGELSKVIVGQARVIDELLIAVLSGGHCLLEGVPGLAKTLLISSLARTLSLSFKRIQFTPDLMPSDITGTEVIQDDPVTHERVFKFLPGPLFAHIILADEINRTPPKTQAAMLEAMQERQVSVGGQRYEMKKPFFVLATQNPLEQEGTYPLPEAQQDRFLFKIFVGYPSDEEEKQIVTRVTGNLFDEVVPVLSGEEVLTAQDIVRRVPVADTVVHYATSLVRATRVGDAGAPDFIKKWVAWGCGPRASISLVAAAKANAALNGRQCASCDDIVRVAHPVMRHRMAVNYTARAEGIATDNVVDELLKTMKKY